MRQYNFSGQDGVIICYICIFESRAMFEFNFKPCTKIIKINFHALVLTSFKIIFASLDGILISFSLLQSLILSSLQTLLTSSTVTYSGSFHEILLLKKFVNNVCIIQLKH